MAFRRYCMLLLLILTLSISFSVTRADSVFVVTMEADTYDGVCDADCTLPEAMNAANANADYSVINFNIPGAGIHTIHRQFGIYIQHPVTIDGTTQPGYAGTPLIELDGDERSGTGITNDYISSNTDGTIIRGLAIIHYGNGGMTLIHANNYVIENNYIGVTADGMSAPGNGFDYTFDLAGNGIEMYRMNDTEIRNNVISGNREAGLLIGDESHNIVVEDNFIGTNPAGTAALGTQHYGVAIGGSSDNILGGTTPSARNIISGNQVGIWLSGADGALPTNNLVQGNYIGTDVTGMLPIGNAVAGIRVSGFYHNVYYHTEDYTIGGTAPGTGNLIAFNGIGVEVQDVAVRIAIEGNSIHSNIGLGIDLNADGVTPNDSGDGDDGPNALQNYPILTDVERTNNQLLISGQLNSAPNKTYRVELFANSTCNVSGNGEGETFLTALNVSTNGSGNATFVYQQPWNANLGGIVTATATDPDNNTSEFSPCAAAVESTILAPEINVYSAMPVLTWNRLAGAAGYEVQVSATITFGLPYAFHNENIPADQLNIPTSGLSDGTYYWRVRAKDSAGNWGAWSAVQTFTITP